MVGDLERTERFEALSVFGNSPRFVERVNDISRLIKVTALRPEVAMQVGRIAAPSVASVTLTLTDEREKEDGKFKTEEFYSNGGLREFVLYLDESRQKLIENPIHVMGLEENVEVEVAMQYNTSFTENIYSFVNNINTREGGTHVQGFRRALSRVFTKYGEDNGLFKKLKFKVSGEDFREGLTAIVSVKVPEPQFKGQTKGELGNSEVLGIVSRCVGEVLGHYLEEHPNESRRIVEQVILAATARHAARMRCPRRELD